MMDIFLGAELEGKAGWMWSGLAGKMTPLLERLKDNNYGESLISIGIISIIRREEVYEDGGYPERRYFSRKRKEADIRLRIDYNKFVRAKEKEREKMYIDHILESLRIAGEKAQKVEKDYKVEQLLSDARELLCASSDEE